MYLGWSKKAWQAFKANPRPGPIQMLNLVRYRDAAEYDDGRQRSGAEAYAEYGRASAAVFARVGGRILWRGRPELILIGPPEAHWDLAFIADYPDASAFADMMRDPEYQRAVIHRTAALADSRLIRMAPNPAGDSFAGN
jgi:uncharacterized protein (DUF1330 family)